MDQLYRRHALVENQGKPGRAILESRRKFRGGILFQRRFRGLINVAVEPRSSRELSRQGYIVLSGDSAFLLEPLCEQC